MYPVPDAPDSALKKLKILLAEDNQLSIFFMKKLFAQWGVHATIVENGQQAIESLAENDYTVILMDMNMPVMDGYEATLNIRQLADPEKANIHIIALTASESDSSRKEMRACGMNDYLHKPFQFEELHHKLLQLSS